MKKEDDLTAQKKEIIMTDLPKVEIHPKKMIGQIVQIVLAKPDDPNKIQAVIPPLRVSNYYFSKDHDSQLTWKEMKPWIYFLGTPIQHVLQIEELKDVFSSVDADDTFMFFSDFHPMQPQYYLDETFLGFMESGKFSMPVEVYTLKESSRTLDADALSYINSYSFIDLGNLQPFISGKGFPSPWPKEYPNIGSIRKIEKALLSNIQ